MVRGRAHQRCYLWTLFVAGLACAVLAVPTSKPSTATEGDIWRLDPEYTDIRFSWDHLGLSRQSAQIRDVYGRLTFAPTDPLRATLEVVARLDGLNTGIPAFDKLLKSPDYFDAAQHPRIEFKSTMIVQSGPKSGKVTGNLTIRGETRPLTLDVRWNYTGEHPLAPYNPVYRGRWVSGFSAKATLLRSNWGLTRATPLVSDEVQLSIEAEFVRVD